MDRESWVWGVDIPMDEYCREFVVDYLKSSNMLY